MSETCECGDDKTDHYIDDDGLERCRVVHLEDIDTGEGGVYRDVETPCLCRKFKPAEETE